MFTAFLVAQSVKNLPAVYPQIPMAFIKMEILLTLDSDILLSGGDGSRIRVGGE